MNPSGPSIWVDVEDIFHYFRFNPHPSGIQRVAVDICRALLAETAAQLCAAPLRFAPLRFTRHGAGQTLREVRWAEVEAMLAVPPANEPPENEEVDDSARRSRVQRAILKLPPDLRDPLFRAGVLQSQVARNVRSLYHTVRPPPPRALREMPDGDAIAASEGPQPGDTYLVLGAPWSVPGSAARLAALRANGVHTALLIHDIIPLRRPEWYAPPRVARFRNWLEASLRASELVLTISAFTAGDVADYAARHGIAEPRLRTLPAGTSTPAAGPVQAAGLPQPGTYALFVSTLEARKNHALLVHVWHKLMAEIRAGARAPQTLPQLVFAGRLGDGVADMMQQLDNSRWLNGRVRLIREPDDAEIRTLYESCLFTLLPSLAEGWGLPLTESLALGKPCLAARATALPEIGGDLCRYFDPEDVGDAHRAIAAILDHPEDLAAWQADIRARFIPRDWRDAASAILDAATVMPA